MCIPKQSCLVLPVFWLLYECNCAIGTWATCFFHSLWWLIYIVRYSWSLSYCNIIFYCVSVLQFAYPFYWWNFGLFLVWAIKKNADKNIIIYVSWCSLFMSFYTSEWNFSSMCVSSSLLEKGQMLPEVLFFFFYQFIIILEGCESYCFLNFQKHVSFPGFNTKQSGGFSVSLIVALFYKSLIIIEIKHLLMYFFTIWVFFFWSIYINLIQVCLYSGYSFFLCFLC